MLEPVAYFSSYNLLWKEKSIKYLTQLSSKNCDWVKRKLNCDLLVLTKLVENTIYQGFSHLKYLCIMRLLSNL